MSRHKYNPFKTTFDYFTRNEPHKIEDYWTGEPLKVIFRNNRDTNQSSSNNVTWWYRPDVPIENGGLYKFRGKVFLALNKESVEYDFHYKSDAVECNSLLSTYIDGKEYAIHVFAYDMTNPSASDSGPISTANGNIELITQSCPTSRAIGINAEFDSDMLGRYRVEEVQDINNIMHYTVARISNKQHEYTLSINAQEAYQTDSYHTFTTTATADGMQIENPLIEWESSDRTICQIIRDTGEAHFIQDGTVTLTAHWLSYDITTTATITISSNSKLLSEIGFSGEAVVKEGSPSWKYFTPKFYNESSNLNPDVVPVWDFEFDPAHPKQAQYIQSTIASDGRIGLKVLNGASNAGLIMSTFNLVLKDEGGLYEESRQQVTIKILY